MTTTTNAKPASQGGATFLDISGSRKMTNNIATAVVWGAMILAMVPLVWVLWELIARGSGVILNPEWWTASGVPSIVAALFIFAMWITLFGFGRSGFAVALSLVLLMIPIVVRNTEEMLRVVPMDLREASYALGVPKWKTIARIVLPTALSGIVTGIMLAIARVMGESSPVLVLVGSSSVINWDAFKGSQSSLPLMMLDMYKAGAQPAVLDKLWGAALTLVILIAVLNIAARIVSAKFSVKK